MNKTFKSIYCEQTNTWVAIPEIAKTAGKKSSKVEQCGSKTSSFLTCCYQKFSLSLLSLVAIFNTSLFADATGTDPSRWNAPDVTATGLNWCYYDHDLEAVVCGDQDTSGGPNSVTLGEDAKTNYGVKKTDAYVSTIEQAVQAGITASQQAGATHDDVRDAVQQVLDASGVTDKDAYFNLGGGAGYLTGSINDNDEFDVVIRKLRDKADEAENLGRIAIGYGALANQGANSIALGKGSVAGTAVQHVNAIAIGNEAKVENKNAIAFGNRAQALKESSIAIGIDAVAREKGGIALGARSESVSSGIALGHDAFADSHETSSSRRLKRDAVAVGGFAFADGDQTVALGSRARAEKDSRLLLEMIPVQQGLVRFP